MLTVSNLEAGYGDVQVLFGVSLSVKAGEVVTLLGRNGMGKTTTIKSIFGLIRPAAGAVEVEGVALAGQPPFRVAQAGLGLVPRAGRSSPTSTSRRTSSPPPPTAPSASRPGRWSASTPSSRG